MSSPVLQTHLEKSADFFLHYTTLGKLFLQTLKIILFICGTVH